VFVKTRFHCNPEVTYSNKNSKKSGGDVSGMQVETENIEIEEAILATGW
jgi:hypothetical protein